VQEVACSDSADADEKAAARGATEQ
jgi:hypothetical protein